nr:immunoglobulin light chain junction region [Macaca mulatta]MPN65519.1 immunoglobulin light chain junction region [Macaca mulatta]MPN65556.1 immunoglobulin light chain junction region [Macaca mulatta]MPN65837.1 immunoglobulin light chain junction region [Macaca mulatta]MPN66869.1 immunoglobulin light chain junction region [Macaca mulatta]
CAAWDNSLSSRLF